MKQIRYMGSFISRKGVVWTIKILQEAEQPFAEIGDLTFDSEEALVITWDERAKHEVIQGSTATIQIESPGDRTYEDLYTVEVGRIRMDVYRDGFLYWSGCLDSEFYEEPYEQESKYIVSLSFSDFGVLDRLKYNLSGILDLQTIVNHCIGATGINVGGCKAEIISTSLTPTGSPMSLSDLSVRSDNYYDEDGEACSLMEVLEGILQPLAMRIIQRNGMVHIYDLNALYNNADSVQVEWNGDSSTMSVDRVYNNAKVTWSTYAQDGNMYPDRCWSGHVKIDTELTNINNNEPAKHGNAEYLSYHYSTNMFDWEDATDSGFTLWVTDQGDNAKLSEGLKFFKIVPQYDGNASEGIAVRYSSFYGVRAGGSGYDEQIFKKWPFGKNKEDLWIDERTVMTSIGPALFTVNPVWIPPVNDPTKLLLRIKMEMLMDPRFNFFEQAANIAHDEPEADWFNEFNASANFIYVPVVIKFKSKDGKVYVWTNHDIVSRTISQPVRSFNETLGKWVEMTDEANPNAWGYLAYYDAKDRNNTCSVLGFHANRPAINPHVQDTVSILTNCDDGQYIPYPPYGDGEMFIEVRGNGWYICNGGKEIDDSYIFNKNSCWKMFNFLLFHLPEVDIKNNQQFNMSIDTDDVEYKSELNGAAKDPLELTTICGTKKGGVPTARGAYFHAGKQIDELTRADRTTQVEELLIGTLYSQYAERRTMLSGEMEILTGDVHKLTEINQQGKSFLLTSDIQNVIKDTSDATIVELRPDEYEKKV